MSAETLREAASKMRDESHGKCTCYLFGYAEREHGELREVEAPLLAALADWLDEEAAEVSSIAAVSPYGPGIESFILNADDAPLRVARAYLGEADA